MTKPLSFRVLCSIFTVALHSAGQRSQMLLLGSAGAPLGLHNHDQLILTLPHNCSLRPYYSSSFSCFFSSSFDPNHSDSASWILLIYYVSVFDRSHTSEHTDEPILYRLPHTEPLKYHCTKALILGMFACKPLKCVRSNSVRSALISRDDT